MLFCWYFETHFRADLLQFVKVMRLTNMNTNFQLSSGQETDWATSIDWFYFQTNVWIVTLLNHPTEFHLIDIKRSFFHISLYMVLLSITWSHVKHSAADEKQCNTLLLSCFTVGSMFFGLNSSFFVFETWCYESIPNNYISPINQKHIIPEVVCLT